ncbi:MAG: metal-dependent hydrolase [Ignavibacterium sp.]|nr:metal-dependent hydrolase [Ignavibacterium sp.]MDW8374338.1 metal-dependent hydrolase [Ignavibacteriales bacterium]
MKIRYLGHSAFQIKTNGYEILIDPFLDDNPVSPIKSKDVHPDFVILTHAHGDHLGDSIKIGNKSNPLFICVNELAEWLKSKGLKAHNMHIGGSRNFEFGKVKFTIAHHGSITPDGNYAGEPAGVILNIENKTIYHTGDTGLFYDMKLIGEINSIDYMFVPIGDNFTMGIDDAVKAVEFVKPKIAIPIHYNTFEIIKADPELFKQKIEANGFNCRIMKFGEEIEV